MIPSHVLIIPDGNRRWAKKRAYKQHLGHEQGARVVEPIALAALKHDIPCLTFWGLSMDNLANRSAVELQALFGIFEKYFKKLTASEMIRDYDVRVQAIGCWKERFPSSTVEAIEQAVDATKYHALHLLNFLLADGESAPPWPKSIPNIDLIIRTGEEDARDGWSHLSDGMRRWPVKNPAVKSLPIFWPDFSENDLSAVLQEYAAIQLRAGK